MLKNRFVSMFVAFGLAFAAYGDTSFTQIDIASRTPIAHVCAMTFISAELGSKNETDDKYGAMSYFLSVLAPLWLLNSLGSRYDTRLQEKDFCYWIFLSLMLTWNVYTVFFITRLGSLITEDVEGAKVKCAIFTTVIICSTTLAYLCRSTPAIMQGLGGTANLNLFVGILGLVLASGLTWFVDSWQKCRNGCCPSHNSDLQAPLSRVVLTVSAHVPRAKAALFHVPYIVAAVLGGCALYIFETRKVNDVLATPAESRMRNQECIFLSVFDIHDLWHIMSALALGEFVRFLIYLNIRNGWIEMTEDSSDQEEMMDARSDPETTSEASDRTWQEDGRRTAPQEER
eukprot:TRINITY_DN15488_c0_g1_i2.p1 TRINITY_DN15488_c0_g1~~TRINITY_DN15488_c0_g1_i2.p1  ORF type:complete len:343 (-),score=36.04 TRINITY_DN15488_c0_g1_i2:239-1267(-)